MDRKIIKKYWKNNEKPFLGDKLVGLILKLSKKYIKGKVLDIGAGSGALIKKIPNAVGIDVIPGRYVIEGDIINLKFDDNFFDTVFCTEVIEHLNNEDIEKGINEIYRVLKSGGNLILTTPYNENLKNGELICPKCNFKFHLWQHLQSFDIKKVKEILKDFEIINIKTKAFSFYTMNSKLYFLEPLVKRLYKDISKTLFVVAKKK